ncbi:hypothetical protein IE077_002670 [Cardiosporidium cionae]|uniref:Uncharacterized protein n=1 Tax=Cardiosporidium cionae TaxID=476202 RepID=A0ABQ7JA79_9APIC|nr:hypothetical protein IE077_002670 [Cardiosporidium cionae]|eukprot:KAF8820913.1 hypothetical protein IE077_002670 [Cardiosporidium cionae]
MMLLFRSGQCASCALLRCFVNVGATGSEIQRLPFVRSYASAAFIFKHKANPLLLQCHAAPMRSTYDEKGIHSSVQSPHFLPKKHFFSRSFSAVARNDEKNKSLEESIETVIHVDALSKGTLLETEVAFFPKPKSSEEKSTKGNWGLSKLVFYLLAHSIPIGCGIYAFKILTEHREGDEAVGTGETPEDITADILKVIRGGASCFCLVEDSGEVYAGHIDPHYPEERVFRLPNATVIPGFKNNALTDALVGSSSDFALPLNFIHFAVKNSSPLYDILTRHRRITLLYHDQERGISITLQGWVAIIESKELKRHYWRSVWGRQFSDSTSSEYSLLKFVPQTLQLQRFGWESHILHRSVQEETIQWQHTHLLEDRKKNKEAVETEKGEEL